MVSRSTELYQFPDSSFRPAPLLPVTHADTTTKPMIQLHGIVVLQSDTEVVHPALEINTDLPDKSVNFLCTTAAFTLSPEPAGFVVLCQLTRGLSLVCGFCSSARTFALRLPSDPSSRRRPCLRLVLVIASISMNTLGSRTGDFHPISSRPCRAYTKRCYGRLIAAADGPVAVSSASCNSRPHNRSSRNRQSKAALCTV